MPGFSRPDTPYVRNTARRSRAALDHESVVPIDPCLGGGVRKCNFQIRETDVPGRPLDRECLDFTDPCAVEARYVQTKIAWKPELLSCVDSCDLSGGFLITRGLRAEF